MDDVEIRRELGELNKTLRAIELVLCEIAKALKEDHMETDYAEAFCRMVGFDNLDDVLPNIDTKGGEQNV